MEVKVLGSGCAKCKKLFSEAEKAIKESGVEAQLIKVEDMQKIVELGVISTPALLINNEVKSSGRLPSSKEIVEWLKTTREIS